MSSDILATTAISAPPGEADLAAVRELAEARRMLLAEIEKRIVGQKEVVEHLLVALFARGHCLFVGVPGLAKTLLISTVAEVLNLTFNRIQFTPDLMPSDITGTDVLEEDHTTGRRAFRFVPGPIFANLLLADEINRTPPKTQAALLQAMQEYRVTAGGQTYPMELPFLVFATQNPIEQEGTYPLPEAQVDRFMLKVKVSYPTREEERAILDRMGTAEPPRAARVAGAAEIARARQVVHRVYVDERLKEYVVSLVLATRDPRGHGLADLDPLIEYGASPRATLYLVAAARGQAFLRRRGYVVPDDVKAVAYDVLRHRIALTYEAEAEEVTPEKVVTRVLERVEVP
jgi:MoxR-like ATPase